MARRLADLESLILSSHMRESGTVNQSVAAITATQTETQQRLKPTQAPRADPLATPQEMNLPKTMLRPR